MEAESKRFYQTAARRSTDVSIRQLLGDLAAEERRHEARAEELEVNMFLPKLRLRRANPSGVCSCCRSCNPVSPG
jgi:erythrin-vacuolar iron transport family protein